MSQKQATLPFEPMVQHNFAQFIGHDKEVEVLQKPEELPQFTYIKGGQATGKSHLLNALYQELSKDHVAMLLEANQVSQVDVVAVMPSGLEFLLIDDADRLAQDDTNELALFNLFNHCKSHGIKLIVTARQHPKSAVWQLPDLISRLNSGLNLHLEPLKGEQALACLALQFQMNGIALDQPVLQFIKTRHNTAYPQLFQLFQDVANESLKFKRKVTIPLIKQVIEFRTSQESEA